MLEMASMTTFCDHSYHLIDSANPLKNASNAMWRVVAPGVRVRITTLQIALPYFNALPLFVKCIKHESAPIIIIGISFSENLSWKGNVMNLKANVPNKPCRHAEVSYNTIR